MKEVNLKNVNDRINRIMESKEIMGRQARLSMNTEFELACLIRLREFMEMEEYDEECLIDIHGSIPQFEVELP